MLVGQCSLLKTKFFKKNINTNLNNQPTILKTLQKE